MTGRIAPLKAFGLAGLIAVNIWLLAILAGEIGSETSIASGGFDWRPDITIAPEGSAARKPVDAYKETLARPIFFKTRQPYVPPPPPSAASQPAAAVAPVVDPGFVLGGVIIERALRKAFLFSRANPQGTWVSEGDNLLGWTLRSVAATGVELQQQGRTIGVSLYPKN